MISAALGGHAGIGGTFVVGVLLRGVHLISICMWIGAIAAMWWLSRQHPALRTLWPTVSILAAIGLAVTGASGLLMSGRVVETVTALLGTDYGKRIVVKMGLILLLAVLGAIASRRVRKGGTPRRLPIELSVAGAAIVVAALLASTAPARGEQFLPLPKEEPQIVTSDVADLTVSASIEPARPGSNLVQVSVLNTRRPVPGVIENVTVRITGGDGSVVAERQGVPVSGVLEWADIAIPNPGTFRVEVDVDRPTLPVSPFVASWAVDAPPVPRVKRCCRPDRGRRWPRCSPPAGSRWSPPAGGGPGSCSRRRHDVAPSGD